MQIEKIKGLINISNKAGYLIIGADNIKKHTKKLYLIVKCEDGGKNLSKISEQKMEKTNCEIITLPNDIFEKIVCIPNCKIVGLKNKGISEEIKKYIRSEN